MRRADRLMELIQILRDGTLHKAADLAAATDVSLRTIYRDMDTLAASGVPIEGERGIGYRVTAAITLPPLNLTMTEVEALHLGLSAVGQSGDRELSAAAAALSAKLDAVMPEDRTRAPRGYGFAIYPFADAARSFQHLPTIRQAIRTRQKLEITKANLTRTVRPLQLDYWGRLWTCVVWCEKSKDFEELRVDEVTGLRILPSLFVDEPGKALSDFNRRQDLRRVGN
ncbi:helix-turn-helix transcriptional regulator [Yoonia sediminilitoris]|uniref:WYL domain-containing protein n=1 Tax=Yoonia sediminilitoris TaxID=1286148 RepID=A0A2T6KDZ7_9RHOB|nr:HTH domain-containing protein [Yoonia sediminilitoris]PUB13265.1 WYL domain-containing protein [Yoonia sediminilitoris]RCW94600.1 WYL domain-containing protein [Yoonia sediminilitoris]